MAYIFDSDMIAVVIHWSALAKRLCDCADRHCMAGLCLQAAQDDPFARYGDFNQLDDLRDPVPVQLKSEHELLCRNVRRAEVFANCLNWYGEGAIAPTETIGRKPQRSVARNECCAETDGPSIHRPPLFGYSNTPIFAYHAALTMRSAP